MKREFILYAQQEGVTMTEACAKYHISRKTGYKWLKRYEKGGMNALQEMSREPKNQPTKLSTDVICRIFSVRNAHKTWGAEKIQAVLSREGYTPVPGRTTIHRVLKKAGLVNAPKRRQKKQENVRLSVEGGVGKEPNDEWTIDFKGWWYSRDGKRKCYPLTIRDAASRFILAVTLLHDCKEESVRKAMIDVFKRYGVPKSIRSDNGPPFASTQSLLGLSKLSVWWIRLGIIPVRSRVGCPQDNGAHERMHKDMRDELEATHADTQAEMDVWRDDYNHLRPHQALGGQTPAERYRRSERAYQASLGRYDYGTLTTRKIDKHGDLKWQGVDYFLSEALRGEEVGLRPLNEHQYEVYFATYKLGVVDTRCETFAPEQKKGAKARFIQGRPQQRPNIREFD